VSRCSNVARVSQTRTFNELLMSLRPSFVQLCYGVTVQVREYWQQSAPLAKHFVCEP